jgi:hypothetical protein
MAPRFVIAAPSQMAMARLPRPVRIHAQVIGQVRKEKCQNFQ